jgi:hypothetical protein
VLLGRASDLDPGDPVSNIRMGTRFLAYLLDQTGGDVDEALAGYNQGLSSVRQRGLYDETRLFVAGVVVLRDRFAEARRGSSQDGDGGRRRRPTAPAWWCCATASPKPAAARPRTATGAGVVARPRGAGWASGVRGGAGGRRHAPQRRPAFHRWV